ncbi:MAG: M28 family peptidase, partial [Gemmatimonadota bacterium]|nr:M28 family peptidase [Gemmatimonadota bacterium]
GQHPTVPASKIIAALNMDVVNVNGRVRDLNVMGDNKSSLGPTLAQMVRAQGIRLSPDAHPEAGHFYRSDHFSFAKVGIPSISIGPGIDYVGKPAGWGQQQAEDWTAHNYHQPSDEYRSDFDLSGAAQLGDIVYRLGVALGNAERVPTWNTDAEFKAMRDASRKGQ